MAAMAMVWEPLTENEVQSFPEKRKLWTVFQTFITT
jgi:hypothetical protein